MKDIKIEPILESAKIGLWIMEILDSKTKHIQANLPGYHLMSAPEDLSPEELYDFWKDRVHPSHWEYLRTMLKTCCNNEFVEVEYPWKHPTKGWRYVRSGAKPTCISDGYIRIEGYHQDITDRVLTGTLGKDYRIVDFYKFRQWSSFFMDVYDLLYEMDPNTQMMKSVFMRKDKFSNLSDAISLADYVETQVHKEDQSRFLSFFEDWKKENQKGAVELRVVTEKDMYLWVQATFVATSLNGQDFWLMCINDIDRFKRIWLQNEGRQSILNAFSQEYDDSYDVDLYNQEVEHLETGDKVSFSSFLSSLCLEYPLDQRERIENFLSVSNLRTILERKESVSLDVQKPHFGWNRITLVMPKFLDGRVLILVKEMSEQHLLQTLLLRYMEMNYSGIGFIDYKEDILIHFKVQDKLLHKAPVHKYSELVQSYIKQYVRIDEQEQAMHDLQLERVVNQIRQKKIYYFSMGAYKNGEYHRILFQFHFYDSTKGYLLLMISDITQQYNREIQETKRIEAMRIKATTDHLTGLSNRYYCETQIRNYLQEEGVHSIGAFLLIDLDDFKDINDTFGHVVGDQALKDVATMLRQHFRSSDIVSRFGGDEFVVFMKDLRGEEVLPGLMNSLVQKFHLPYQMENKRICLSISIGIAISPKDGLTMDELYHKADRALYRVKKQGKQNYGIYDRFIDGEEEI